MKLYTRLFYILLAVFVVGVTIVCAVSAMSVWSRIATGLITGAVVGIVSTLTNYYHVRQTYFEKMVMSLMEVERTLGDDHTLAQARNSFIADLSKSAMIEFAAKSETAETTMPKADELAAKYKRMASQFDFEEYAAIIPWGHRKLKETLDELDRLISFNLVHLKGFYLTCYAFNMISAPVSEEEQRIVIGDPDDFFDYTVRRNKDYEDLLAFYLDSFAKLAESLSSEAGHFLSKMYRELLSYIPTFVRSVNIRDAVIRDVISENAEAGQ